MPMTKQKELLERVLLGDRAAISFCETLFSISQTWDDVVDRDKGLTDFEVNGMMWEALITLPNNPFYQQYFDILNPIMQAAIIDWMDSNKLIQSDEHEQKVAAYVLRDSLTNIVIHCARLVGGFDWMAEVSMDIREALYDEPLTKFLEEHNG